MVFLFAVFQVFNGGYHAKTKTKCLSLMVAGSIAGNALMGFIQSQKIFMIASAVVLSIAIIAVGSVTNARHPVSKMTYNRSRRIARVALTLNLLAAASMLVIGRNTEAAAIVSTLYLYVASLLAAKIKNILSF